MDSFEALIGKSINEVTLNESPNFFLAPLKYSLTLCGRRYPATKYRLADIDYYILFKDYYFIKKAIDNGEAHNLTEGDTTYLGAARINEKVPQPNSDRLANKREFVLKKKYLQKIINEMGY